MLGAKGILTPMMHGLLRISCSRNPKTSQIRSFFYEKWLLCEQLVLLLKNRRYRRAGRTITVLCSGCFQINGWMSKVTFNCLFFLEGSIALSHGFSNAEINWQHYIVLLYSLSIQHVEQHLCCHCTLLTHILPHRRQCRHHH